jgi:hypothetical protein
MESTWFHFHLTYMSIVEKIVDGANIKSVSFKFYMGFSFAHGAFHCLLLCPSYRHVWESLHLSRRTTVIQDLLVRRQFSLVPANWTNVYVEHCLPYYINLGLIQHCVIKFVSDLRQVGGFLRVLRFPPPIKLTATI